MEVSTLLAALKECFSGSVRGRGADSTRVLQLLPQLIDQLLKSAGMGGGQAASYAKTVCGLVAMSLGEYKEMMSSTAGLGAPVLLSKFMKLLLKPELRSAHQELERVCMLLLDHLQSCGQALLLQLFFLGSIDLLADVDALQTARTASCTAAACELKCYWDAFSEFVESAKEDRPDQQAASSSSGDLDCSGSIFLVLQKPSLQELEWLSRFALRTLNHLLGAHAHELLEVMPGPALIDAVCRVLQRSSSTMASQALAMAVLAKASSALPAAGQLATVVLPALLGVTQRCCRKLPSLSNLQPAEKPALQLWMDSLTELVHLLIPHPAMALPMSGVAAELAGALVRIAVQLPGLDLRPALQSSLLDAASQVIERQPGVRWPCTILPELLDALAGRAARALEGLYECCVAADEAGSQVRDVANASGNGESEARAGLREGLRDAAAVGRCMSAVLRSELRQSADAPLLDQAEGSGGQACRQQRLWPPLAVAAEPSDPWATHFGQDPHLRAAGRGQGGGAAEQPPEQPPAKKPRLCLIPPPPGGASGTAAVAAETPGSTAADGAGGRCSDRSQQLLDRFLKHLPWLGCERAEPGAGQRRGCVRQGCASLLAAALLIRHCGGALPRAIRRRLGLVLAHQLSACRPQLAGSDAPLLLHWSLLVAVFQYLLAALRGRDPEPVPALAGDDADGGRCSAGVWDALRAPLPEAGSPRLRWLSAQVQAMLAGCGSVCLLAQALPTGLAVSPSASGKQRSSSSGSGGGGGGGFAALHSQVSRLVSAAATDAEAEAGAGGAGGGAAAAGHASLGVASNEGPADSCLPACLLQLLPATLLAPALLPAPPTSLLPPGGAEAPEGGWLPVAASRTAQLLRAQLHSSWPASSGAAASEGRHTACRHRVAAVVGGAMSLVGTCLALQQHDTSGVLHAPSATPGADTLEPAPQSRPSRAAIDCMLSAASRVLDAVLHPGNEALHLQEVWAPDAERASLSELCLAACRRLAADEAPRAGAGAAAVGLDCVQQLLHDLLQAVQQGQPPAGTDDPRSCFGGGRGAELGWSVQACSFALTHVCMSLLPPGTACNLKELAQQLLACCKPDSQHTVRVWAAATKQLLQPPLLWAACDIPEAHRELSAPHPQLSARQKAGGGGDAGPLSPVAAEWLEIGQLRLVQVLEERMTATWQDLVQEGLGDADSRMVFLQLQAAVEVYKQPWLSQKAQSAVLATLLRGLSRSAGPDGCNARQLLLELSRAKQCSLAQLLLTGADTDAYQLDAIAVMITKAPSLLQVLWQVTGLELRELVRLVLPRAIDWLGKQPQGTELLSNLATRLAQMEKLPRPACSGGRPGSGTGEGSAAAPAALRPADLLVEHVVLAMARAFWTGDPNALHRLFDFVAEVSGEDCDTLMGDDKFCRELVEEIIWQAGEEERWSAGYEASEDVVSRLRDYLASIALVLQPSKGFDGPLQLLQHDDNVSWILYQLGKRVAEQRREKSRTAALQAVRAITVLLHVLDHTVGSYAPQYMTILSSAVGHISRGWEAVQKQGLHSWQTFIRQLASRNRALLQQCSARIAVVVYPIIEAALEGQQQQQQGLQEEQRDEGQGAAEAALAARRPFAAAVPAADVVAAAAEVLRELVVVQGLVLGDANLLELPPFPPAPELEDVHATILSAKNREHARERSRAESQAQRPCRFTDDPIHDSICLLIDQLKSQSLDVCYTALRELERVLSVNPEWVSGVVEDAQQRSRDACTDGRSLMAAGSTPAGSRSPHLLDRLLSALLRCCKPSVHTATTVAIRSWSSRCLGLIGAVDPASVRVVSREQVKRLEELAEVHRCTGDSALVLEVFKAFLIPQLWSLCNLDQLSFVIYAIQQLLRHFNGSQDDPSRRLVVEMEEEADSSGTEQCKATRLQYSDLFSAVPEPMQEAVQPYRRSMFTLEAAKPLEGVVFGRELSFRRWLGEFLVRIMQHTGGSVRAVLYTVHAAMLYEVRFMLFLLPYTVQNALGHSGRVARETVAEEVCAVLAGAERDDISDLQLHLQAVFALLDTLGNWVATSSTLRRQRPAAAQGEDTDEAHVRWAAEAKQLLSGVPLNHLASAAHRCGAYARAVQYYESFVRSSHGGALNQARGKAGEISISDDQLTELLKLHKSLRDPDSLLGLVTLRKGGPSMADRILAAEQGGRWSDALGLYEQSLPAHGGSVQSGSSASPGAAAPAQMRGRLECLMSMGCLQTAHLVLDGLLPQLAGRPDAEGEAAGSEEARATLLAMDLSVSWRRGDWARAAARQHDLVGAGVAASVLPAVLRWDMRLSQLLLCLQKDRPPAETSPPVSYGEPTRGPTNDVLVKLEAARNEVIGPLAAACMESYSRAYPHLLQLHMLQDIQDALVCLRHQTQHQSQPPLHSLPAPTKRGIQSAMGALAQQGLAGPRTRLFGSGLARRIGGAAQLFSAREPLLSLHRQLGLTLFDSSGAAAMLLDQAVLYRASGHLEAAQTAVLEARKLRLPGSVREHACLLWDQGRAREAVEELQLGCQQQDQGLPPEDLDSLSEAQQKRCLLNRRLQLLQWLTDLGQCGRDALEKEYERLIKLDEHGEESHFAFACFLDQVYCNARQRQMSSAASAAGRQGSSANPLDRLLGRSRIPLGEDAPYAAYLPQVLLEYGRAMQYGARHMHQALPRMLTLLYDFSMDLVQSERSSRSGSSTEPGSGSPVRQAMNQAMATMTRLKKEVPTVKWLPAIPQLVSRICHPQVEVQQFTHMLLISLTLLPNPHPQQVLWHLVAVSHSEVAARKRHADAIISKARASQQSADRAIFATHSDFCAQLIHLTMFQPTDGRSSGGRRGPASLSVSQHFRSLQRMLPLKIIMPTLSSLTAGFPQPPPPSLMGGSDFLAAGGAPRPPASGGRAQSEVVTISGILDKINLLPSLMRPKKLTLIGSDGLEYAFLAKPQDDLRKDGRLMEVATMINRLLARHPDARRRNLRIRTFAVTPLTERSGLVQWVPSCMGLRFVCEGVYTEAGLFTRKKLVEVKSKHEQCPRKLDWLTGMLQEYPPLMHRWFLDKFPEPAAWLAAQQAWTRTTAVWSMVGHMVGLGDRHGENLLLDQTCGDLVMVDFSMLFDKGLTLEVPELVPFRLTQNMVDSFGVSGTEGGFRRSAEIVLQVLRSNRETIVSVLETFVHDPFVDWVRDVRSSAAASRSSKSGRQPQSAAATGPQENPHAKDALETIKGRLEGTLLGVASLPSLPLSVEGQTHRLIQEATDLDKLSRMYIWWMPWL